MNIPRETLPSYLGESEHKAFAEKARTGPIDASAGLRATLSQAFHEPPPGTPAKEEAARNDSPRPWTSADGERRQQERRKNHQAVVLDTRMKQRRREVLPYPSVNFEI